MKPFQYSQYVGLAFKQFNRSGGAYIGLMLLAALSYILLSLIPTVGSVLTTLVCSPMVAGIFLYARLKDTGEIPLFTTFFGVFSNRYYLAFAAQNIFVTLISFCAFAIGVYFLLGDQIETIMDAIERMHSGNERDFLYALNIMNENTVLSAFLIGLIPAIAVSVLYFFAPLFVVLNEMSFWPALEGSRKFVSKRFGAVFILFLIIILLNVIGALLCCVGLIVSIPVSYLIMYNAYVDQIESAHSL